MPAHSFAALRGGVCGYALIWPPNIEAADFRLILGGNHDPHRIDRCRTGRSVWRSLGQSQYRDTTQYRASTRYHITNQLCGDDWRGYRRHSCDSHTGGRSGKRDRLMTDFPAHSSAAAEECAGTLVSHENTSVNCPSRRISRRGPCLWGVEILSVS